MTSYAVPLTNHLSKATGTARVTAEGPAPRVDSVEVRSWSPEGYPQIELLVRFAIGSERERPSGPFGLWLRANNGNGGGQLRIVQDGDDHLDSFADIDEAYVLRRDGMADPWERATTMDVTVTVQYWRGA